MSLGRHGYEERSHAEAGAVPGKRGLRCAQGNVRRAQGQFRVYLRLILFPRLIRAGQFIAAPIPRVRTRFMSAATGE